MCKSTARRSHRSRLVPSHGSRSTHGMGAFIWQDILSYAGWTRTDRRVLYRTYDVTRLLNATGGGQLLVALGCGYRFCTANEVLKGPTAWAAPGSQAVRQSLSRCDPKGRFPSYKDQADRSNDTIAKIFRLQLRING